MAIQIRTLGWPEKSKNVVGTLPCHVAEPCSQCEQQQSQAFPNRWQHQMIWDAKELKPRSYLDVPATGYKLIPRAFISVPPK